MKELKTLLSINLSLVLLLNCLCPVAFATETEDETEQSTIPTVVEEDLALSTGDTAGTEESSEILLLSDSTQTEAETEPVASGLCGADVAWSLSAEGVLTISGSGAMDDYDFTSVPWQDYQYGDIKCLVVCDGVTSIGATAFYFCSSLESASLPSSITSIGNNAFSYCSALNSISIPNGVSEIGVSAFSDCNNLQTISFPSGLMSISDRAFQNCDALQTIIIPDSVTTIGQSAFLNCDALTSVFIGSGIRSIGVKAFLNCNNLSQVTIDQYELLVTNHGNIPSTATVVYKAADPAVIIQTWNVGSLDETDVTATLYSDGKLVISGTGGFKRASWPTAITAVEIDDGITSMPSSVFYNHTNLSTVKIGYGITSIPSSAFARCTNLTNIDLGDNITQIGSHAFENCTSLKSIDLGSKLTSIGMSAFSGAGLTTLTIPDSISSIQAYAFAGCISLEFLYVGSGLQSLGSCAFSNSQKLNQITWNAKRLGAYSPAFGYTGNLGADSTVFYAAGSAGDGITLTIGPAVEAIPDYLFYVSGNDSSGFVNLKHIENQSQNLTHIGSYAFYNCAELEDVDFGICLETIGDGAFNSCAALSSVDFPGTLASVGRKAFFRTGLTAVTLGRQVTSIGENAFSECCDNLTVYGYIGTCAETHALENGFTFVAAETVILTLSGNYNGISDYLVDVNPGSQIDLTEYSDLFEQEMSKITPGARLINWTTTTEGTSASYETDATLTVNEDTALYAQWEIPTILIGGETVPIDSTSVGDTWQYTWFGANRPAVIVLTNYQGGCISAPINLHINVQGNSAIESQEGSALSGQQVYFVMEDDAILTVCSGQDAPAIQCTTFGVHGTGSITVSTENAIAILASKSLTYNLNGTSIFTAEETAISSNVIKIHNASDVYLSVEATEPSAAYDNGAYLRLEPKTWELKLSANGGTWTDQSEDVKTVKSFLQKLVSLADFSELLSRDGFILTGWCDEDDTVEYSLDALIASSANLNLFAAWTECALVIDGEVIDADTAQSGDGWSYVPSTDNSLPKLNLINYDGSRIYSTSDLEIVSSGTSRITGPVGEPAIKVLGSLMLTVADGMLTVYGGVGEHAVYANGSVTIDNQGSLSIQGGNGGTAIHCFDDLIVQNSGEFTAVGGTISYALYSKSDIILEGTGKDIFVSGSPSYPAVSCGNLVLNSGLKFYGGENASTARRCFARPWYSYMRIQEKTIVITLNANGGKLPETVVSTQEYVQSVENTVCLSSVSVPTRFGFAFTGWNTESDGSGIEYTASEPMAFSETTDSIELYAQWEELDYDIIVGDQLTLRLRASLQEDAVVILAIYTEQGQMESVLYGTLGDDGLWRFPIAMPQNSNQIKIFFLDNQHSPVRDAIDPSI